MLGKTKIITWSCEVRLAARENPFANVQSSALLPNNPW